MLLPNPIIIFIILFLFTIASVSAWGVLGHATVVEIASIYLTTRAKTYVANLLRPDLTMPLRATYGTARPFILSLRWKDDSPSSCEVDSMSDCGPGGRIVSAVAKNVGRPFSPPFVSFR